MQNTSKKKLSKLTLHKETLRYLQHPEQIRIVGGWYKYTAGCFELDYMAWVALGTDYNTCTRIPGHFYPLQSDVR